MKRLLDTLVKTIALVLISALSTPSIAVARPKPQNPETIHRKIVQRGIGNWVCVEEANGILLTGRVTTIEEQAFGMQLENYPDITMIPYADVVRLRSLSSSGKTMGIWIGASVGAFVAIALIMHHEFEKNKPTLPQNPTVPAWP
jgi:hypothetical protein